MNSVAVALVEQHLLLRAGASVEEHRADDGTVTYSLHFDVVKGNVGERYTITFDKKGFDWFVAQCQAVKSGIETATKIPEVGRIH